MAGVLYIVENATVMYSLGMDGVLYCLKSKNYVQLGIYSIKILKQGIVADLFHGKDQNKVQLGIFFSEKAKIKFSFLPNFTWRVKFIRIFKNRVVGFRSFYYNNYMKSRGFFFQKFATCLPHLL